MTNRDEHRSRTGNSGSRDPQQRRASERAGRGGTTPRRSSSFPGYHSETGSRGEVGYRGETGYRGEVSKRGEAGYRGESSSANRGRRAGTPRRPATPRGSTFPGDPARATTSSRSGASDTRNRRPRSGTEDNRTTRSQRATTSPVTSGHRPSSSNWGGSWREETQRRPDGSRAGGSRAGGSRAANSRAGDSRAGGSRVGGSRSETTQARGPRAGRGKQPARAAGTRDTTAPRERRRPAGQASSTGRRPAGSHPRTAGRNDQRGQRPQTGTKTSSTRPRTIREFFGSWPGRILIALVIILAIAGMAYSVYATAKHNNTKTASKQAVQRAEDEAAMPVICEAAKLDKEIQIPQFATVGEAISANLKIVNKMGRPCYFDLSGTTVTMKVVTGKDTVFDGANCPVKIPVKRILLDRDMEWQTSTTWDGKVRANGCEPGAAAHPGTYRVQLYFGDKKIGGEQPLLISDSKQAQKPAPKQKAQ